MHILNIVSTPMCLRQHDVGYFCIRCLLTNRSISRKTEHIVGVSGEIDYVVQITTIKPPCFHVLLNCIKDARISLNHSHETPWNMLYNKLLRNVSATVIYNATMAPLEMNLETAWLSLRHIHITIIRAELIVTKLDHRLVCLFRNSHHIALYICYPECYSHRLYSFG